MIKIINKLGDNELIVTKGAYDDLYKNLGYKIVEKEEVKEEIEEIDSLTSDLTDKDEKEETVKSEESFKTNSNRKKK